MASRPAARPSGHAAHLRIGHDLLARQAEYARRNDRGREILTLHDSAQDPLHRMLNAIQPGSYIQPHRHLEPPKSEGIVILQGVLGFAGFDDEGELDREACCVLSRESGQFGIDIRPGYWHTILALAPDTVIYEAKTGPYDPTTDKDFAPWAPAPDTPEATSYLHRLEEELSGLTQRLPPDLLDRAAPRRDDRKR